MAAHEEILQMIRDLIADGKTKKAVEELRKLSQQKMFSHLANQAALLSHDFSLYEHDVLQNVLNQQEKDIKLAAINSRILGIAGNLNEVQPTFHPSSDTGSQDAAIPNIQGNGNISLNQIRDASITINIGAQSQEQNTNKHS